MQNEGPPIVAKTLRRAADAYACACDDQPKLSKIARTLPGVLRDACTDVSFKVVGIRYAMGGQETKIRAQPAARPRAPAKCSGNAPQPELVTRPGEEHPCGVGTPATPAAATPRAPESAALRVVYEIHLIGGREQRCVYDLRSTMYFAIAIRGIAASP